MRGELRSRGGIAEKRRHAGRTGLQCCARLARDPIGADPGAAIGLKALDIEVERFSERPEIGQLLVTLAREERAGERPEGTLHPRSLRGLGGTPSRNAPRAQDEVPQVDPQRDRLQPSHHEGAVRARQVGVHHEQRRIGWPIDPWRGVSRTLGMRVHVLSRAHELEGTPQEVFPFFADAFNLESITPPFLGFGVVTPPPIPLQTGTIIQYAMRLHGLPVTWVSSIQRWEPPHCFVDTQLRGPYRFWHHTHSFEPLPGGRTLMRDEVRYQLPVPPLGELALPVVRRDLDRIFDYRREVLPARLAEFLERPELRTPAGGSSAAAPTRR